MKNSKHISIISAKAGILGGRFRGSLRVYALGEGTETDICFSLKLWQAPHCGFTRNTSRKITADPCHDPEIHSAGQAAAVRQERLAGRTACTVH